MKSWQKVGAITLVMLAIFGIRFYFLWKERNAPVVQKPQRQERPLTDDDIVSPRKLLIDDLKSAKVLIGKTVLIQAGFELEYFPYVHHSINFAHMIGVLPSVQELEIKEIILAKAPPSKNSRIPRGDKQVFAVFQMPGDATEYATAIGYIQGKDSTYYCDDIFYYVDPHQPKPGMNELQVAMALGVIQQSDSSNYGNRTVHYETGGKQWDVSFQNDKATNVQTE